MTTLASKLIFTIMILALFIYIGYIIIWALDTSFPDRRARMAKIRARKAKEQTNLLKDIKYGTCKPNTPRTTETKPTTNRN